MIDTISINIALVINNFFALKYFCRVPTGLSEKNDTKFPNPKKSPTRSVD
jgi:hypothetical protein